MIAPSWEQHCAQYVPGRYSHDVERDAMEHDADTLQRVLGEALWRAATNELRAVA